MRCVPSNEQQATHHTTALRHPTAQREHRGASAELTGASMLVPRPGSRIGRHRSLAALAAGRAPSAQYGARRGDSAQAAVRPQNIPIDAAANSGTHRRNEGTHVATARRPTSARPTGQEQPPDDPRAYGMQHSLSASRRTPCRAMGMAPPAAPMQALPEEDMARQRQRLTPLCHCATMCFQTAPCCSQATMCQGRLS